MGRPRPRRSQCLADQNLAQHSWRQAEANTNANGIELIPLVRLSCRAEGSHFCSCRWQQTSHSSFLTPKLLRVWPASECLREAARELAESGRKNRERARKEEGGNKGRRRRRRRVKRGFAANKGKNSEKEEEESVEENRRALSLESNFIPSCRRQVC